MAEAFAVPVPAVRFLSAVTASRPFCELRARDTTELLSVPIRPAVGHPSLAVGEPREFVVGIEARNDGIVE